MKKKHGPRYGLYFVLALLLNTVVYVVLARTLGNDGRFAAATVFASINIVIIVAYKILDRRYQRRLKAGLADPGPTLAEVARDLRSRGKQPRGWKEAEEGADVYN